MAIAVDSRNSYNGLRGHHNHSMSMDSIAAGGQSWMRKRFPRSLSSNGNWPWLRKSDDDVLKSPAPCLSTSPSLPELSSGVSPTSPGSSPPLSPYPPSPPCIRHSVASERMKGEDLFIAAPDFKLNDYHSFSLFAVFDGHNGLGAAFHARNNLIGYVRERVKSIEDRDELLKALREALAHAFVCANGTLAAGERSGTTATVVLINEWTVTVAGVGDSRAILDTAPGGVTPLTKDHRFETSEEECRRVQAEGGTLGRLRTSDGIQVGPKRFWPGGLCVSRSVGDLDVGPCIIPLPQVVQVEVPRCGGRLVMGSDGLWDAFSSSEKAARVVRGRENADCARKLAKRVLKAKGLHDDITVIVVDIVPAHAPDALASPGMKKSASGGRLFARLKRSLSSKSMSGEFDGSMNSPGSSVVGSPNFLEDHDSSQHGGSAYHTYLMYINKRAEMEDREGEGEGEGEGGGASRRVARREEEKGVVKHHRENSSRGQKDGCQAEGEDESSRSSREKAGESGEEELQEVDVVEAGWRQEDAAEGADATSASARASSKSEKTSSLVSVRKEEREEEEEEEEEEKRRRGGSGYQRERESSMRWEMEVGRPWNERDVEREDEEEEDAGDLELSKATKMSPEDGAWCWQCGAPVSPLLGSKEDVSIRAGHGYCSEHKPCPDPSASSSSCPDSSLTSPGPSQQIAPAVVVVDSHGHSQTTLVENGISCTLDKLTLRCDDDDRGVDRVEKARPNHLFVPAGVTGLAFLVDKPAPTRQA